MIAILRIRFDTNNDLTSVWSDTVFERWMQPLIPFSLGDFWWSSSMGLFDLTYTIYSPIVMADPRPTAPAGNDAQRAALVNGAIAAATAQVSPNWDETDILMIWYAQPTDQFGGGSYSIPLQGGGTKTIPVTVVHIASPFDAVCQELGHGFGLQHEIDDEGRDYACPYSVMSARLVAEFLRPADPRLPDGLKILNTGDPFFNNPAGRIIGPALSAAQLYKYPEFRDTPKVLQLSANYVQSPAVVRLNALNYTVTLPEGPLPLLVTFPSNRSDGRIFTVEMRRGGFDYDTAIGTPRSDGTVYPAHLALTDA